MAAYSTRPVVKTIKGRNGDIIDCVNIYKQPAFDHHMLKNHTIQMSSVRHPTRRKSTAPPIQQKWHRSGTCPDGTIPILRTRDNKIPVNSSPNKVSSSNAGPRTDLAMAYNNGGPFEEAYGIIYSWTAHVEPKEFSLNLVGCASSDAPHLFPGSIQTIVSVGWGVIPAIFGDTQSRLIVAWSNDHNLENWCFNFGCPGFIQTNKDIVLGEILSNTSIYGGEQFDLPVGVYRDRFLQRWVVTVDEEEVGYFPVQVFNNLWQCSTAFWGGLVLELGPFPTPTQMGNGHFSTEGPEKTGLITNALVIRHDEDPSGEAPSGYAITRPLCYSFNDYGPVFKKWPGRSYLYGGPGAGSAQCV